MLLVGVVVVVGIVVAMLIVLVVNEVIWWAKRIVLRKRYYRLARERATLLSKPLMIIGDPDAGYTNKLLGADYPCGDVTLDLSLSAKCKRSGGGVEGDIRDTLPSFADNSHVIFVSYVLEYVEDLHKVIPELMRIAGSADNLFVVHASQYALWSRLRKSSSLTDPEAVNVITAAPPQSRAISFFKL